jgi:hypothetical protein
MISDLLLAKFTSELSFLQGFLEDEGIPSSLLDSSQGVELPVLTALLQSGEREQPIHFIFVPAGEELETLQLLQMYAPISTQVEDRYLPAFLQVLVTVNRIVGLGSFGLDPENQIYYKHIFPKPKYERWNRDLVMEAFFLFLFLMERFENVLLSAATGQVSVEKAMAELGKIQAAGNE